MAEDGFESRRPNYRAFTRRRVSIAASIRQQGGGRHQVEVFELSQAGFRMRSAAFLLSNQAIFLTLPDYSPLKARIVWISDAIYGCEFIQRLHEAIFDDLVKRYPLLDARTSQP